MAAFAAVAMAFASCSEDEAFAPNASDMVQIASAQIAVETTTRVNSLGAGDVFENGDNILLVNHSRGVHNKGTYTATISGSTAQWNLTDGAVLWAPGSGENQLTAYHPATDQFVLPADQSTEEKLIAADSYCRSKQRRCSRPHLQSPHGQGDLRASFGRGSHHSQ